MITTTKKKIWAIYSKSEKGWWHKTLGWTFSLNFATKFSIDEQAAFEYPLCTKHVDAQWICTDFSQIK